MLHGTTKLYFAHYSCVVIIFYNTDLYKSPFSTLLFWEISFLFFSGFCIFYLLNSISFFVELIIAFIYNNDCLNNCHLAICDFAT